MYAVDAQVADGLRSTVPTVFLTKAYQLVDDPCVDHIISWTGSGSTFVIWSPGHFARDIRPHKFDHNFTSFICQLNTYGFRMISPNPCEFVHEFFRRGEKHLLDRIVRRRSSSGSTSASSGDEPVLWSDSYGETTELWKENERLKCENTWLTLENEKMKILFDNIRHRLSNYSGNGGGDDGDRLEAAVSAGITGGEGRQNNDVEVGFHQAPEEWEIPLEGPSGSEDSEFFPGE